MAAANLSLRAIDNFPRCNIWWNCRNTRLQNNIQSKFLYCSSTEVFPSRSDIIQNLETIFGRAISIPFAVWLYFVAVLEDPSKAATLLWIRFQLLLCDLCDGVTLTSQTSFRNSTAKEWKFLGTETECYPVFVRMWCTVFQQKDNPGVRSLA